MKVINVGIQNNISYIYSMKKITQKVKSGVVEYLQYERDERVNDDIAGGYTREEHIKHNPVWGKTDAELLALVELFIQTEGLDVIEKNWVNYDDTDFDNAFCCYCWEWICEQ